LTESANYAIHLAFPQAEKNPAGRLMVSALWLAHALFFAQANGAVPPPVAPPALARLHFEDVPFTWDDADSTGAERLVNSPLGPPEESATTSVILPTLEAEPAPLASVFSRPWCSDRHSISGVVGAGPGRFNIIDWESRPNGDRLWWLARWPLEQEAQLHAHIGFNFHWWAGPVSNGPESTPNLQPVLYDLYLDCTWAQHWTDWLVSEVRFRPGLYTDFRTTPPDSFRAPGQAIVLLRAGERLHLVGGIDYVQRNDLQLLPVAGVLWQPSQRWELRLVFPEPKIAFELSTREQVWGYVVGEYGGGRWTYEHESGRGERVEYSDFRVVAGIEWREDSLSNLLGCQKSGSFLEVGYVFERHLRFSGPSRGFDPEPAWMIRLGRTW
jgi:hypothetical protein